MTTNIICDTNNKFLKNMLYVCRSGIYSKKEILEIGDIQNESNLERCEVFLRPNYSTHRNRRDWKKIFSGEIKSFVHRGDLFLNVTHLKGLLCEKCKKYKAQEIHHINGIRLDNRLENLIGLCGNCHNDITYNYAKTNYNYFTKRLFGCNKPNKNFESYRLVDNFYQNEILNKQYVLDL